MSTLFGKDLCCLCRIQINSHHFSNSRVSFWRIYDQKVMMSIFRKSELITNEDVTIMHDLWEHGHMRIQGKKTNKQKTQTKRDPKKLQPLYCYWMSLCGSSSFICFASFCGCSASFYGHFHLFVVVLSLFEHFSFPCGHFKPAIHLPLSVAVLIFYGIFVSSFGSKFVSFWYIG